MVPPPIIPSRTVHRAEKEALTDGRERCYEGGRARRKRIRISKTLHPFLTERQQTVLKGKVRFSSAWSKVVRTLAETGQTMEEFVETLSAEELVRGQIKAKNGTFQGAPPKWVPRAFHRACIAELMRRGRYLWQDNYLKAIETMTEIASGRGAGEAATPGERMKAAQFVIERLEGKIPEKLMVVNDSPWQVVIEDIVGEVDDKAIQRGRKALESAESSLDDIVDAEIVDEDMDPEPEPVPIRPVRNSSRPVRSQRRRSR